MPYVRHRVDVPPERLQELIDPPEDYRIYYGNNLPYGHPAAWHGKPCMYVRSHGEPCAQCADFWRKYDTFMAEYLPKRLEIILATYDNPALAHAEKRSGEKITFVLSREDHDKWIEREQERFQSGVYARVPWYEWEDPESLRFAHLSLDCPGMIAYTRSPEHGFLDRQTRVRPGKYLTEFFPEWDKPTVDRYIAQCQADQLKLHLATTPDEIRKVYEGGPQSCMAGPASKFRSYPVHPVEVYGDSDLAVAYYGRIERVSARAVVWPERKLYGRIYGGSTLRELLHRAGYQEGSMAGAKVRALEADCGLYVMPYIDGIGSAKVRRIADRSWAVLGVLGDGDLDCQRTDGLAAEPDEDDCEPDGWYCEHCDGYQPEDESQYSVYYIGPSGRVRSRTVCESCWENDYGLCDDCERYFLTDCLHSTVNGYLCPSCADNLPVASCAVPDCDETWRERLLPDERSEDRADHICPDHEDGYWYCVDCAAAIDATTEHDHNSPELEREAS